LHHGRQPHKISDHRDSPLVPPTEQYWLGARSTKGKLGKPRKMRRDGAKAKPRQCLAPVDAFFDGQAGFLFFPTAFFVNAVGKKRNSTMLAFRTQRSVPIASVLMLSPRVHQAKHTGSRREPYVGCGTLAKDKCGKN